MYLLCGFASNPKTKVPYLLMVTYLFVKICMYLFTKEWMIIYDFMPNQWKLYVVVMLGIIYC